MMTANFQAGQPEPKPQFSAMVAASLPEHPSRLLVADDEHLIATGLAATLEELGYTVVGPAADADEAIALCQSEKPDLALVDIQMGDRSGLDAADVLFNKLATPVIIFSAYSDEKYVEASTRIGVFNYLLKPVPKEQLRVAIELAWGRFCDHARKSVELHQLRSRLEQRKIIEQAKWLLVKSKDISEPEAMKMLQIQARNTRTPLVDIARAVLESENLFSA